MTDAVPTAAVETGARPRRRIPLLDLLQLVCIGLFMAALPAGGFAIAGWAGLFFGIAASSLALLLLLAIEPRR